MRATRRAFVATRLRPAADGRGWVLRLLNASAGPAKLLLAGEAFDRGGVFLSDLWEAEGPRLEAAREVPAFGILTLLVKAH